jgi:hypothetical protein
MCREKNHCEQDVQVDLCFLNFQCKMCCIAIIEAVLSATNDHANLAAELSPRAGTAHACRS